MSKILLAESERDLSLSIKRYLCLYNVDVLIVNDGVQALNEFSNDAFDVVIIDDNLSRINTKEVIRRIKEKNKGIKIVLLSNKTICEDFDGCDDIIMSPFTAFDLKNSLCKVGSVL